MPASAQHDNLQIVIPIVAGIGNALMAVPMARQIKTHRPGWRVTIVARTPAMAEPFRRLPQADQVLVCRGNLESVFAARRQKADVYLVPFPSNRWQYNVLAAASGAKRVVMHGYDFGRLRTLAFLHRERIVAQRGIHDVVQNLRLLTLLGIEPDMNDRPTFAINDEDRRWANELLPETENFIAVHAGSARTILARAKRWPAGKYAELIRGLLKENRVVLLEGPDEQGVTDEIVRLLDGRPGIQIPGLLPLKLTGSLGDAAAILHRAMLYVGTDSGLAHLAAAVGTRAVTLFAPADPDRVSPFGYRDLVVQPPCDCCPCFLYPWQAAKPKMRCREPMCIDSIEPATVMQMVRKAMNHE